MEEKKKKGGARNNAGRKPSIDPKKPITIYLSASSIIEQGGQDKVRDKFYNFAANGFASNPISERAPEMPSKKTIKVKDYTKPTNVVKSITDKPASTNININTYPDRLDGESLIDYRIRKGEKS